MVSILGCDPFELAQFRTDQFGLKRGDNGAEIQDTAEYSPQVWGGGYGWPSNWSWRQGLMYLLTHRSTPNFWPTTMRASSRRTGRCTQTKGFRNLKKNDDPNAQFRTWPVQDAHPTHRPTHRPTAPKYRTRQFRTGPIRKDRTLMNCLF